MRLYGRYIFHCFLLIPVLIIHNRGTAQHRPPVKEWAKSFGGFGTDEAHDIIQTSDGGFAIAGRAFSTDGEVTDNVPAKNNWIVKTDAAGNILWKKSYGN